MARPQRPIINGKKQCTNCDVIKPIKEFCKDSNSSNGLHYWCRTCVSDRWHVQYKNPEFRKRKAELGDAWYRSHPYRVWATHTIDGHCRLGYVVNITINQLEELAKTITVCFVCGGELDYSRGKGRVRYNSPTLGRMESGKVMTLSNSRIMCYRCNKTQQDMSWDKFIVFCGMVWKKFGTS